jgi:4-amino-4-deoxychorismate lyase
MYPVFESIKVTKEGCSNLEYHINRMQQTALKLWGNLMMFNDIRDEVQSIFVQEIHKCNVYYNQYDFKLDIQPYEKKEINKLIIIRDDMIEYDIKYTNRSRFELAEKLISYDEQIIFCKQGLLTDTTYSNIALWNGNSWLTPSVPLLKGTKRQFLLDRNLLTATDIHFNEIHHFRKISLINAMLDLGDVEIAIEHVQII